MKKYERSLSYILIIICILLVFPIVAFAHSGRTDSRGGHKDNKNKSGLGYYHYHCGGHPVHLYPDGICPYSGYSGNNSSNYSNSNSYTNNNYQDYIVMDDCPKSIEVGDDIILNFTIYSYYDDFIYTITSTNTSAIRVNGSVLEAVGAGTSDIIIETSHISKTITIQVKEVLAEKFKIYSKLEKLQLGENLSIVYRIEPNNTTNKNVEFSSSNTNIAVIEGDIIVPIGVGDVTITGKTSNRLADSFDISIYEVFHVPCERVDIIDSTEYMISNFIDMLNEILLDSKISPYNATYQNITWSSSDSNIVSIENDKFIINGTGKVIITCTTRDGMTSSVIININLFWAIL